MSFLKALRIFILIGVQCASINSFSQSISNTGKLNYPRSFHQSHILPDGRVIVFGGWNNIYPTPTTYETAEIYNPETRSWGLAASMNQTRVFFTSVVLPSGNVLAIGGDSDGNFNPLKSCEVYDVKSNKWMVTAEMNVARRNHRAIKLRNGNILVAGGTDDGTCELYDAASSTWRYTGKLNISRGDEGISLVMLVNGSILLTGGETQEASRSAEIYNPQNGQWTLVENRLSFSRTDHNSILLANGTVLIVGSAFTGSQGTEYSEVYNVGTKSFEKEARHQVLISKNNPLLLLDDGSVLVHTQGNYYSNTQAFQLYKPSTGSWTAMMNTNFFGNNAYRIHKLHDGSILVIGGYTSIDIGATKDCLLVREGGVDVCSSVKLDLELSNNTFCYGNAGKVVVSQSESGASYQAYIGDLPVSTPVSGGGNIELDIPASFIVSGVNLVKVRVKKSGCVSKFLNDIAVLDARQENISKPTITALRPTTFCSGDSTILKAPSGFYRYEWSNGSTTSEITVKGQPGFYSVKVSNSIGCSSPASDPVNIMLYPLSVWAGSDETVCINSPSYTLREYSPLGGTWTGPGVSAGGQFTPTLAGVGTHKLTYTSPCNKQDIKIITVRPIPVISNFTYRWEQEQICENASTRLYLQNTDNGTSYQLRIGSRNIGSSQMSTGGTLTFYIPSNTVDTTTVFNVVASRYTECGLITLQKSDILNVVRSPRNLVTTVLRDSVCYGEQTYIRIEKSEPGITYYLTNNSNILIGEYVDGTGGDLLIPTGRIEYSLSGSLFAKNALSSCSRMKIKDIKIYLKPLTVDFETGLPGDFVGDTIRLINKSNAQSYTWKFISQASIETSINTNPGLITYNSVGKKLIKLTGISSIGCVDSVAKEIEISNRINSRPYTLCYDEQLNQSDVTVLDHHIDRNGNTYIAGHKNRTLFCLKADSTGKKVWSREGIPYYGSTNYSNGVTSDNEGNVYVVGQGSGDHFRFGKFECYTGQNHQNAPFMYIIKFNKVGEEQWFVIGLTTVTEYHYDNWIIASDIACDDNNRLFIVGHRNLKSSQIRFPGGQVKTLEPRNNPDAKECFILEIDSTGAMRDYVEFGGGSAKSLLSYPESWRTTINGWVDDSPVSISMYESIAVNPKVKIDSDGDVLVGGVFEATDTSVPFKFGNIGLYAEEHQAYTPFSGSTFVAEYNRENGWKSATKGVSWGVDYLQEFTKDSEGNIYTIGPLVKETIINGDTIALDDPSNGAAWPRPRHSYLAKNNAAGNIEWYVLNESAYLDDVEVSSHNTILVAGDVDRFGATRDAKGQSFGIQANGKRDGFISEYTDDGKVIWAKSIGTSEIDRPYYMALDKCNNIYVSSASFQSYYHRSGSVRVSKLSVDADCNMAVCDREPLTLTSFDPQAGTINDRVNIKGSNFTYVSKIEFNGVEASFTIEDNNVIVARVPLNATTGKIKLFTYNDSTSSVNDFVVEQSMQFIGFSPNTGTYGDSVYIHAKNIEGLQTIKFNGNEVSDFVVVNDSTVYTSVPYNATTGKIKLISLRDSIVSVDDFTVQRTFEDIEFVNFFPRSGSWGTAVTIYARNISHLRKIKLGDIPVTDFLILNDSTIKMTVPYGAMTGNIMLANDFDSTMSRDNFIVERAINTITFIDFEPRSGIYGANVTIHADNINTVTAVSFGDIKVKDFILLNDTTIQVPVPEGAVTGFIGLHNETEASFSPEMFKVEIPTNINETVIENCKVYPNPTSSKMILDCSLMGPIFRVEVFNMIGAIVISERVDGKDTITLEHLSPGLYKVLLHNDSQRHTLLILKQ